MTLFMRCRSLIYSVIVQVQIKGRFLEFQRYHNFANLFSQLAESTFYTEIRKFQKKYRAKSIRLAVFTRDSLTMLPTPVRAVFSFVPKLTMQPLSRCNTFCRNIYEFTMPGPPEELMTSEKIIFRE